MMIDASRIEQLTQKLEIQGDITTEEADKIYALASSVVKAAYDIIDRKPTIYEREIHELLSKDFPVSALMRWYDAVTDKIRASQSGNFIFSILIDFGSYYYHHLNIAVKTLKGDVSYSKSPLGAFEDRITSIRANKQIYKLFPKPFKELFQWRENFQWDPYKRLFELKTNRAGFYRYPLRELEGDSISQFFKKLSLKSIMIPQGEDTIISAINVGRYVLAYLKQKVSFIQMNAIRRYYDDIAVVTNEEGLWIAKRALEIPIEDFLKNAIAQNIIDNKMADELLKTNGFFASFPKTTFTEANIKYIDDIIKAKKEWEVLRKAVEEENEWLEEIR